jgi:hypothetical protein
MRLLLMSSHLPDQKATWHGVVLSRFVTLLNMIGTLCGSAATVHAEPNKIQYELQERCGKGAKQFFYDEGYMALGYNNYESHYNSELNKCSIFLQRYASNDKSTTKEESLLDINARKLYGYLHIFQMHGEYTLPAALNCQVEGTACRSENEWKALIEPYMSK